MSRIFGKKKRRTSGGDSDQVSLNITALADVFVIILVFMLKSFTAGAIDLTPSAGVHLPVSDAPTLNVDAMRIEISKNGVTIGEKPIVVLKNYGFDGTDLRSNGTSKILSKALNIERQRQVLIAQSNSAVKVDAKVIVVSDRHTPYATIKTVLASAAVNGFTDFKLAVVKPE